MEFGDLTRKIFWQNERLANPVVTAGAGADDDSHW